MTNYTSSPHILTEDGWAYVAPAIGGGTTSREWQRKFPSLWHAVSAASQDLLVAADLVRNKQVKARLMLHWDTVDGIAHALDRYARRPQLPVNQPDANAPNLLEQGRLEEPRQLDQGMTSTSGDAQTSYPPVDCLNGTAREQLAREGSCNASSLERSGSIDAEVDNTTVPGTPSPQTHERPHDHGYAQDNFHDYDAKGVRLDATPSPQTQPAYRFACQTWGEDWASNEWAHLVDFAAAMNSQPARPTPLMPIETAPKDGTWFLAYREAADCGSWDRFVVVRWHDEFSDFIWPDQPFDIFNDDIDEIRENGFHVQSPYESTGTFTAWCPLPAHDPSPQQNVKGSGDTIMKADVEKMIRDWQDECADHPALHNQGNVLLDRLKALKPSLAMNDFLAGMDCLAQLPTRLTPLEEKYVALAKEIVKGNGFNHPDPRNDNMRLVGFRVPVKIAGLSEALFALDAIRAVTALATEGKV